MVLGALQGIIGLTLFINGVVWGIVFFGFSEVIKLLQGIYNQREVSLSETNSSVKETPSNLNISDLLGDNDVKISEVVRNEIISFYSSKGLTVQEIACTDKEDFFLVTVDGKNETVELGGFNPVIHPS
ncbi:hypothetical protein [Halobacillus dabanensis]|nr:hypothetical protein [Halobacillus dabanensis]